MLELVSGVGAGQAPDQYRRQETRPPAVVVVRTGEPGPSQFAEQGLVGCVELAVHQSDDGGQGEAPVLQGTNPCDALEMVGVVPRPLVLDAEVA